MNPARIAIVDDDALFADYLATSLRAKGYEAVTFTGGAGLLATLATSPAPDLVLLDVQMPGMSGMDTLRAIRTAYPGMPVVMLSGLQTPATIVEAVRFGAVDYVLKLDDSPVLDEAGLEAAICRSLERVTLTNEVERLSAQLRDSPDGAQPCWGTSPAMRHVMTMLDRVADSDVSVLLTGESGVGKEVIARELHRRSTRRLKPFVKVNCAALPSELLESELFGHEKGAFTGAQLSRVGKFEFANDGTLMLDEIGEMPVGLQAKLLHVLQDRTFTKLGSNRAVNVDIRVIAATNRDLATQIKAGQFREDLYYRLQVIEIVVPPLRRRVDEIVPLAEYFVRRYAERYGRPVLRPSERICQALKAYEWPGNVRELENMMKRFIILRDEAMLLEELQRPPVSEPDEVSTSSAAAHERPTSGATRPSPERRPDVTRPLPELAREAALGAEAIAIRTALDHFRWNRRKAAVQLGVSYKTLLTKMKECRISGPGGEAMDEA